MKHYLALLMLAAAAIVAPAAAQQPRATPYWASIDSGRAMMRSGPGQTYPGIWLYVRHDLPIRVVRVYQDWRQIEDPDGQRGWMLVRLLSDQRTAIVRGATRDLHEAPDAASPVRFRAEAGVVGRISRCAGGWCRLDTAGGRGGYIRMDQIWGVDPNETVR